MKRRDFLVSGAGAAALSIAPAAGAVAATSAGASAPKSAARLDKTTFRTLVGERFALRDGAPGATLVLAAVHEQSPGTGGQLEQFSLVFEPADGRPLQTRTHLLSHPALGLFALYLECADAGSVNAARADFSLLA